MKPIVKGFLLGASLVVASTLCVPLLEHSPFSILVIPIIFFLITVVFLIEKNIPALLTCGFIGLFFMFFLQIAMMLSVGGIFLQALFAYVSGFYGSMIALVVACIMTVKGKTLSDLLVKEVPSMELTQNKKIFLLSYALISALGFSYLVVPERAGISILLFAVLQFAFAFYFVPDKKRLLYFIPIFAMALNSFVSAANIWRSTNLILSFVLYAAMFVKPDFCTDSFRSLGQFAKRLVRPLRHFALPLRWALDMNKGKTAILRRVLLALVIALPAAGILIGLLSSADMVFSLGTKQLYDSFMSFFNFHAIPVMLWGILAGLYLFGTVYLSLAPATDDEEAEDRLPIRGDVMVINIILSVILFVYTLFVIVQFKYLFAGAVLPQGLSYTEYARKGFFELLALTGVNIAAILAVTHLTKTKTGSWVKLTRILCHYLCAVTVVLLISSFYRMLLYTGDDGLTRLRLFVLGFLIFEAFGLVLTFFYIAKPKFNISLCYLVIALSYYTVLNLVPTDYIIAKNQVDLYLGGQREDIQYVYTLSPDIAPALLYLDENTDNEGEKIFLKTFLKNACREDIPERWQRYNLSRERAKVIANKINAWNVWVMQE